MLPSSALFMVDSVSMYSFLISNDIVAFVVVVVVVAFVVVVVVVVTMP
jgi:hypothetical protein